MPTRDLLPLVVSGRVKDGRLLSSREAIRSAIAKWPDCEVVISIRPAKDTRTLAQNAYYWACVRIVADYTGHDVEEIHDIAKAKFLPKHLCLADQNGEIVEDLVIGGSTRKLGITGMSEYIDRFNAWATETLGVILPSPPSLGA